MEINLLIRANQAKLYDYEWTWNEGRELIEKRKQSKTDDR